MALGTFRIAYGGSPSMGDYAIQAARNRYVILHAWETDQRNQLKAANPNVKCLVYRNLTRVANEADTFGHGMWTGTGMTKSVAQANGWASAVGDWDVPVDGVIARIDQPGYATAWRDIVLEYLADYPGWDGVFLDDMNAVGDGYLPDNDWRAAQSALNAVVGPGIMNEGYLAIPNMAGTWGQYLSFCNDQLQYFDGGFDEFFCVWPGGNLSHSFKLQSMNAMSTCLGQGKIHLAHSPMTDQNDATVALFGFYMSLMATDQSVRSSYVATYDYNSPPPFLPEYQEAALLGNPLGAYQMTGDGFVRQFENGKAVVNWNGSAGSVDGVSLAAYSGKTILNSPISRKVRVGGTWINSTRKVRVGGTWK